MKAELVPWADWNQLRDPLPAGLPASDSADDCGPESVAEVIYHVSGVQLEAGYIRDEMYGAGYVGYTDVPHLTSYLKDRAGIPCWSTSGDANTKLQHTVQSSLLAGCPVIVLFFWDLNPQSPTYLTGGHFAPVVACDDQVVTRSNPWTGQRETWSWAHFETFQKFGTAIVCQRKRSVLPVVPVPPAAPTVKG